MYNLGAPYGDIYDEIDVSDFNDVEVESNSIYGITFTMKSDSDADMSDYYTDVAWENSDEPVAWGWSGDSTEWTLILMVPFSEDTLTVTIE